MKLEVTRAKTSDLVPHPKNARQGDVGVITQSLEAHGQFRPLVVQTGTNHVLVGNHTLRAMLALGWKDADVTYLDVGDDEALRILLVDNRSSDLAAYDDSVLAALLTELAGTERAFDGTGFDADDLDDLLLILNGPMIQQSDDPIGDVHKFLDTVRLIFELPRETAERFRDLPGDNDQDRFMRLLGVR